MKVLGLDQSTTHSGYCLIEDGKILEYGVIDSKTTLENLYDRIIIMINEVETLINKYKPDYLCLEDIHFKYGRFHAFKSLAILRGAILLLWWLKKSSLPIIINCVTARTRLKIKGNATKEEIVEVLNKTLKLKLTNEHVADAIVIAIVGYQMIKNKEVISELKNSKLFSYENNQTKQNQETISQDKKLEDLKVKKKSKVKK